MNHLRIAKLVFHGCQTFQVCLGWCFPLCLRPAGRASVGAAVGWAVILRRGSCAICTCPDGEVIELETQMIQRYQSRIWMWAGCLNHWLICALLSYMKINVYILSTCILPPQIPTFFQRINAPTWHSVRCGAGGLGGWWCAPGGPRCGH